MVKNLLQHLNTQPCGAGWDLPKGAEGAGRNAHEGTYNNLPASPE